jgi:SWI/SNF-related matrix-associated actin-dependent regulator of chromatin subfamily D
MTILPSLYQKFQNRNQSMRSLTHPTEFIAQWLSSQKRDLEVIAGEATRGGGEDASGDEWRRGGKNGIWGSDNVRESVNLIVGTKGRA